MTIGLVARYAQLYRDVDLLTIEAHDAMAFQFMKRRQRKVCYMGK